MIVLLPFFWNALYFKLDQHTNTLARMDIPLQRQSRMTLTFPLVALLIARMERAHERLNDFFEYLLPISSIAPVMVEPARLLGIIPLQMAGSNSDARARNQPTRIMSQCSQQLSQEYDGERRA
jgi:hypothetical protein